MTDALTQLLDAGEQRAVVTRPPKSHLRVWLAVLLLTIYVGIVLAATMSPTPLDQGYDSAINKILGVAHRNGVPERFGYTELEFGANIAMFVPLGFLVGLALPNKIAWLGIFLVPGFSALIEFLQGQFLSERISSPQDVLANSIGGLFGLLFAYILRALVHGRDQKVLRREIWDQRYGTRARR